MRGSFRRRTGQADYVTLVTCDLAKDLDAWITSLTEAAQGKANENYIGGILKTFEDVPF